MRNSRIKAKLARNEPTLIVSLHLTDPSVYEMAALMGFDGLWMDLEHHGYTVETATALMRAARVGSSDIIARPAKGEMMRMGRLLEAGATGIMYPRCDNAEEAAEVVRWAKFPPMGTRGIDTANADMPYLSMPLTSYLEKANDETFVIIQLEDASAIENAESIAAVDGVDILMIGPTDLSASLGIPGQLDHPRLVEAARHVAQAATSAGKHWGRPIFTPQGAKELIDMGARFITCGADIVMLKTALEAMQQEFAPAGFGFDNRFGV